MRKVLMTSLVLLASVTATAVQAQGFFGSFEISSSSFSNVVVQATKSTCGGSKFGGGQISCGVEAQFSINETGGETFTSEVTEGTGAGALPSIVSTFGDAEGSVNGHAFTTATCSGSIKGFGSLRCQSASRAGSTGSQSFTSFFAD